jgi:hypothetical protein
LICFCISRSLRYIIRFLFESFCFLFFIIHLFMCAYIVWVISSPWLLPPPFPSFPPHFQAELVLPLSLILLKRRHKHSKKDSVFASWVKDSYTERFLALLPCINVLQPKLIHL